MYFYIHNKCTHTHIMYAIVFILATINRCPALVLTITTQKICCEMYYYRINIAIYIKYILDPSIQFWVAHNWCWATINCDYSHPKYKFMFILYMCAVYIYYVYKDKHTVFLLKKIYIYIYIYITNIHSTHTHVLCTLFFFFLDPINHCPALVLTITTLKICCEMY